MGCKKPIPVKPEDIEVGKKYYTCSYTGIEMVTVIKIFMKENTVLVKVRSDKCKPFTRKMNYIFDNAQMAKGAVRSWKHDQRKKKKNNIEA